jgi:hypothetical protein
VFVRAEPGVSGDGFMFYSRIVNVRGLAVGGFGGNGLLLFSRRATIANSTFLSQITGNYLGIDPSGARAAGNALRGIMTDDFNGEIARNVIGGNGRSGIFIGGVGSVSILDNRLGVAAAANDPIPNGASGIYLARRTGVFSHSTITGNVVANSGEWGIALGRDAAVNIDLGVNTLFANRLRGIDVGLDGPTLDRPAEVAPLITSARFDEASGDTIIAGTTPVGVYKTRTEIYLYANTRLDADGFAEGEEFLGVAFLPPGGVFELRVHRDLRGKWIDGTTHTINNLSDLLVYETSEFSRPVRVGD